jgi:transcriptional regulator with XRE-family HTH domain
MPVKLKETNDRRVSPLHLQSWLKHRGMTSAELASRIEASTSVISKLLNGKQRYNQDLLERIAFVLDCDIPALFRDPARPSANELIDRMSPDDRDRSMKILQTMVPKKSG